MSKFPFYRQLDEMDCGPTCLRIIAKHYGKSVSTEVLFKRTNMSKRGVSFTNISDAAESLGFRSMPVDTSFKDLKNDVPLPCIAHWRNKHFLVIYKISKDKVYVSDPSFGLIKLTYQDFLEGWINNTAKLETKGGYLLSPQKNPRHVVSWVLFFEMSRLIYYL